MQHENCLPYTRERRCLLWQEAKEQTSEAEVYGPESVSEKTGAINSSTKIPLEKDKASTIRHCLACAKKRSKS